MLREPTLQEIQQTLNGPWYKSIDPALEHFLLGERMSMYRAGEHVCVIDIFDDGAALAIWRKNVTGEIPYGLYSNDQAHNNTDT